MVILFISELNYYLTKDVQPELFVDTTRGQKLRINIDIDFPKVPCACEWIFFHVNIYEIAEKIYYRGKGSYAEIKKLKLFSKFTTKYNTCSIHVKIQCNKISVL